MKKHLKKILSFGVALSILLTMLITPNASTDIEVVVTSNPKIDIMLTSKDTTVNLKNFETDIKNALKSNNININDIVFQTVERKFVSTNESSAASIFNDWECINVFNTGYYTSSSLNNQVNGSSASPDHFIINEKLNAVESNYNLYDATGKVEPACGFYDPNGFSTSNATYKFTYGINPSNYGNFTHGEAGFIFKMQDPLNYWVYIMDNHSACGNIRYDYKEALVKVTNGNYKVITTNSFPSFSTSLKQDVEIITEGNNIKVYRGGSLRLQATDTGTLYSRGSYGFYVWIQKGAYFSNISVDTESIKTYKNVLTEPTWREDAKHLVVNVDDTIDETLTGQNTIGEILSRTLADDIHFIQWGTNTNKESSSNFIKQNDNKGLFTYNTNYEQAVIDTVNYIKELVEQQETEEQYITIGQEINLTVMPEGFEKNAISDKYPNGRWKINHEYKYFTNNLGQSAAAGFYSPSLNCNFDKPGKYEITFDDKVVKTIYIHRKPVADFEINIENLAIELKNVSYDLDSNNGNGIASEKWYYKEASAATWTEGKLTTLDKTKIYVIKLEVTDYQGSTNYTTKYVGTGSPVSKFNFANDTICKYNKLEINNTSYDPIGYDISTEYWTLKKNGQIIGTYSEPILDFNTSDLGPGNYSYTLTVTNSAGTKSESYTKSFTIVDDVAKPEVAVNAEISNNWDTETQVDIEISDNESNVSKWRYEFVTSPTPTIEDNEWSNWETEKTEMTINSGTLSGRYYLHIQAYDEANNLTERTIGPFNLDNTNPVINGVDVEKQGFRDNKVTIHAFDEHSGIIGYALTKYETATYTARTFAAVETPEFQESNEFKVESDGLYTAWAIDALGNIETSVCEITNSNQTDKTTTVYAEIGSEFKVTIPKKIVLDGATKSGTYTVTVEGDIAGLEIVNVTPDSAVTLSSKDKADVIGTITQDKLNWTYSEIYTDSKILANGAISAQGITAGAWNGTFNFAIKLENNGKYTNSEWSVEYQDVTFDMEELDNSEVTEPTE